MQNLTNIKPSTFTRGAYVGYAAGAVWSITRGTGDWLAIPRQADAPESIKPIRLRERTLWHLSQALESLNP